MQTVGHQWGNCLAELDEKNEVIPEPAESCEPNEHATGFRPPPRIPQESATPEQRHLGPAVVPEVGRPVHREGHSREDGHAVATGRVKSRRRA